MPSKFQLLRSETTRNIIRNPSVENDLTDWQHIGSGISRSPNEARFDRFSVRVFTSGLVDREGVYVRSFPNTQATPYAGSVYVRGRGRVRLRMQDAANGLEFASDMINLETDPNLPIPPCEPNSLFFSPGADINCGSDASIDDLPTKTDFTFEAWVRLDSTGEGGTGRIFDKTQLRFNNNPGLQGFANFTITDANSVTNVASFIPDGSWRHLAMTFDLAAGLIRIWIDGLEAQYITQTVAAGAYVTDAAGSWTLGNNVPGGIRALDGDMGWTRLSTILRYTENFDPPGRCALPEIDSDTLGQWIGVEADGEGPLVENQEGTAALDGTETGTVMSCSCTDPGVGRRWHRLEVLGQTGEQPSDDLRLIVETDGIQETAFYVDGAQIEQKDYVTTYIDGEQPGGRWNIKKHGSVSDRLSNDRKGGRFINIDEDTLGIYATVTAGIGMPPLRHNLQGQSLVPGVEFQSTKILARSIQLTVWAKPSKSCPNALEGIHELRQDMIDIIKPDRTDPDQPFILRYNGGDIPLDIEVLYEAGVEFEGDIRNQFFNSFVIRFLAPDPFWAEDNQHVALLDPIEVLSIQNGLIGKQNRAWTDLGLTDGLVVGMAIGQDGNLYACGQFTVIGGVGANGIAGYDGTDWFPLGAGINIVGGTPLNIAFGPDGSLYVCGSFLDAGGIANTRAIARWDFGAETWNSVAGGLDAAAFSMSFAPNGSLFVTGDLLQGDPNGVPVTANRIIELTSAGAWQALVDTGTGGLNGLTAAAGLEIVVGPDSIVYIGGAFTNAGGVADTDSIALWNPGIQEFASMGGDADDDIKAIAVTEDGKVYIGGLFTTIGGVSLNRAAIWNGSSWSQLAGGINGDVRWIFIEETGRVWYVGDFTAVIDINGDDVVNTDHVAIWDGSQWVPPDFTVPTNLTRMRTLVTSGEDRFYGGEGALGNALVSVPNTDIDSLASALSYPIFHFRRDAGTSATIIQLLNEDTRREMTLTYEMSDGEEVEIDFRPGKRTVQSSLFDVAIDVAEAFRNRLDAVVPGSDFANFVLIPGEQTITVFVTIVGNATLEASMRWQPLHWSADAGVL